MMATGSKTHISLLRKVGTEGIQHQQSVNSMGVIDSLLWHPPSIGNVADACARAADEFCRFPMYSCSAPGPAVTFTAAQTRWRKLVRVVGWCMCVCARRFIGVIGAFYYLVSFNVNLWWLRSVAAGFLFARWLLQRAALIEQCARGDKTK